MGENAWLRLRARGPPKPVVIAERHQDPITRSWTYEVEDEAGQLVPNARGGYEHAENRLVREGDRA